MQVQKKWLAIVIFILVSFKCRVGDGRLIVVNQKNSSDSCNSLQREGGGYCNSLQTVLHFVANSTKIGNGSSIVEVQVAEGSYELGDPVSAGGGFCGSWNGREFQCQAKSLQLQFYSKQCCVWRWHLLPGRT